MGFALYVGDCREVMPKHGMVNLVDAVVTDPPYGLEFMGKGWDKGVPGVEFWEAVIGAMKPGAHLLAFGGTRTFHRLTCAIEDAGFEIRDCLIWVYGSGFPKSLDVSKAIDKAAGVKREKVSGGVGPAWQRSIGNTRPWMEEQDHQIDGPDAITDAAKEWEGWGTALKPAWEPIILARKPLIGTVANNVLEHGVGGLNIDGCRVKSEDIVWEEQRNRVFLSAAFVVLETKLEELDHCPSFVGDGVERPLNERDRVHHANISRQGIGCLDGMSKGNMSINSSTEKYGRMPTAQSPEDIAFIIETTSKSIIDWKTWNSCQSHNILAITRESITTAMRNLKHAESRLGITGAGRWPANLIHDGSDEVVELFPESKVSGTAKLNKPTTSRPESANVYGEYAPHTSIIPNDSGSAARFFYTAKASKKERGEGNNHPTIKPLQLMRYLCRLITPPNGLILDPFMGSGSTLVAATLEGFHSIGIDTEPSYVAIAHRRIREAIHQLK